MRRERQPTGAMRYQSYRTTAQAYFVLLQSERSVTTAALFIYEAYVEATANCIAWASRD